MILSADYATVVKTLFDIDGCKGVKMSQSYRSHINSTLMKAIATQLTGKYVTNDLRRRISPTAKNEFLVPAIMQPVFDDIFHLTTAFCEKFLNDEYACICKKLTAALCRKRPSPLKKGKKLTWAAGIVYTAGWINFLGDNDQSPYMSTKELADRFDVGVSTMSGKKLQIQNALNLIRLDPDYTLGSRLEDNPLIWIVEVNGLLMDMRSAEPEIQQAAFDKGLIPFIPTNVRKVKPEQKDCTTILKFPTTEVKAAQCKPYRRSDDEGPTLFDGLEE